MRESLVANLANHQYIIKLKQQYHQQQHHYLIKFVITISNILAAIFNCQTYIAKIFNHIRTKHYCCQIKEDLSLQFS